MRRYHLKVCVNVSWQDLRVYGSHSSWGRRTYMLPLHSCRRPGKPASEPRGLWVTDTLCAYVTTVSCWWKKSNFTLSCCCQRPLLTRQWTADPITQLLPVFCSWFLSSLLHLVLRKGQVVTGYYRWLQRRGGYLWIQSTATVSINHKAPHERNVIWVNYVLRWVETQTNCVS